MTDTGQQPAEDDQKRLFREALERKKRKGAGEEHLDGGGVHGAQKTTQQRVFRRKSG